MDVVEKASAICEAWRRCTGAEAPTRIAVTYPLAQADFETNDGDAWAGAHNWGATDYRGLGHAELASFHSGDLKPGMWLHSDGTWGSARRPDDVAQLHIDTHPGPTGSVQYPMWFAAFADDAGGATYFLRIVLRMVGQMLAGADATLSDYATALYCHGYFEGFHPGARPVKDRTLPLTAPEQSNVDDYVKNLSRCLASLETQLAAKSWQPPTIPAPPPSNPAGESGGAEGDAEDPLPHVDQPDTKDV